MSIFCVRVLKLTCCVVQGFNGADLRNICTEAGMSAIRAERDYVIHEDFMKVLPPILINWFKFISEPELV